MKPKAPEDLPKIFSRLRSLLASYSPPLAVATDFPGRYGLSSIKEIEIAGREKHELSFATVIIQKTYVGFYFMPIYTHPALLASIPEDLRKLLKGKSCFHVKTLPPALFIQLGKLTKEGFRLYKKEGLIS